MICESFNSKKQYNKLKDLVFGKYNHKNCLENFSSRRWREVFLIVFELLDDPEEALSLAKLQIDNLISDDKVIQSVLSSLKEISKDSFCDAKHKKSAVRGLILDDFFSQGLYHPLESIIAYITTLYSTNDVETGKVFHRIIDEIIVNCNTKFLLAKAIDSNVIEDLNILISQVKNMLPDNVWNKDCLIKWYKDNGDIWKHEIQELKSKCPSNIIEELLQGDAKKQNLLKQYYEANILLLECIDHSPKISSKTREKTEENLFLPIISMAQSVIQGGSVDQS